MCFMSFGLVNARIQNSPPKVADFGLTVPGDILQFVVMRQVRKRMHTLEIKYRAGGFVAKCSCGKRISSPKGCNRSGMNYAQVYAWQAYKVHCESLGQKPIMHPDCQGLYGVSA